MRPALRSDNFAVQVVLNVKVMMEAQHSTPTSLHDVLLECFNLIPIIYPMWLNKTTIISGLPVSGPRFEHWILLIWSMIPSYLATIRLIPSNYPMIDSCRMYFPFCPQETWSYTRAKLGSTKEWTRVSRPLLCIAYTYPHHILPHSELLSAGSCAF